jgi:hypothetical protein
VAKSDELSREPDYELENFGGVRRNFHTKRPSAIFAFILSLIGASYLIQTTLAANISLNSSGPVEFGQGITQTVACSGSTNLAVTPNSTFVNASGGGDFYFSSVSDRDFTIKAYGASSSTPLALFNATSDRAVVINDNGTFQLGMGSTGVTITQSSGTFTINFTSPVALSSTVFRITLESGDQAEVYRVGSIGPGGGEIFYVSNTPFSCGPSLNLMCSYLEAAPISGTNAWVDANYLWSGNTNTAVGASAQGTAIGTGYSNTLAAVGQAGGGNTAGRAVTAARAYRGPNNLSDWYVPSLDELAQLYLKLADVNIDLSFDDYWSSTESDANHARIKWFGGDGSTWDNDKGTLNALRPIRAF